MRELTYSQDAADILLFLLEHYNGAGVVNIGDTHEYSVKHVVELLCKYLEYGGDIVWDTSKPSGQYQKSSSNEKLLGTGWKKEHYTPLPRGLKKTCEWFKLNHSIARGVN